MLTAEPSPWSHSFYFSWKHLNYNILFFTFCWGNIKKYWQASHATANHLPNRQLPATTDCMAQLGNLNLAISLLSLRLWIYPPTLRRGQSSRVLFTTMPAPCIDRSPHDQPITTPIYPVESKLLKLIITSQINVSIKSQFTGCQYSNFWTNW